MALINFQELVVCELGMVQKMMRTIIYWRDHSVNRQDVNNQPAASAFYNAKGEINIYFFFY